MTKAKLHPLMRGMRGKMGDIVIKRWNGRTILAAAPDVEGRTPTPAQLAQRERFKQAVRYARRALREPAKRAVYEAMHAATKVPVAALAVMDYFTPPDVEAIDLSAYHGQVGDTIAICATDNVYVSAVSVEIRDAAGALVEQGAAPEVEPGSGEWRYVAAARTGMEPPPRVTVTASDLPGHSTSRSAAPQPQLLPAVALEQ